MKKLISLNYNANIDENLLLKCKLKRFPCGEFEFSIQEEISDCEIEIYQSFEVGKFNDDLMKLQIVCDVLKRNNAKSISYFAPFLPYTRQDRTYNLTSSLGSKLVAEIINNCGISKITTYDFHTLQMEGYFKGQIYNLSAIPLFLDDIEKKFDEKDVVVVFPDAGSASRFKRFFDDTEYDIAIIQKVRKEGNILMKILGDVDGKTAIIIDDMIDSGNTLIEAFKVLENKNVKEIFVYATHGIFSFNNFDKMFPNDKVKNITITNSIKKDFPADKRFTIIKL